MTIQQESLFPDIRWAISTNNRYIVAAKAGQKDILKRFEELKNQQFL
jgi:hypothetical protein